MNVRKVLTIFLAILIASSIVGIALSHMEMPWFIAVIIGILIGGTICSFGYFWASNKKDREAEASRNGINNNTPSL